MSEASVHPTTQAGDVELMEPKPQGGAATPDIGSIHSGGPVAEVDHDDHDDHDDHHVIEMSRQDSVLDVFLPDSDVTLDAYVHWSEEKRRRFIDKYEDKHFPHLMQFIRERGWVEDASTMGFQSIFYRKDGQIHVNAVSGYLRPGDLVAIIGEGGTPLLQVLAGRATGGKLSGNILINSKPINNSFGRTVGLVPKEDIHLPTLTVRETLMFAAQIRLPETDFPEVMKELRVELVMKALGLAHVAESIVGGGSLRGISGGEKRRLSVAVEVIAGHPILLMDKPTNGLDSATALDLVRRSRMAVESGKAVMMSLVQPSPEIFNMVDRVMVLSRGACIYSGPPQNAAEYFHKLGFVQPAGKSDPDFLEELARTPNKFIEAPPAAVIHPSPVPTAKQLNDESDAFEREAHSSIQVSEYKDSESAMTNTNNGNTNKDDPEETENKEANDNDNNEGEEKRWEFSRTTRDVWSYLTASYHKSEGHQDNGDVLWNDFAPKYDLEDPDEPLKYNTSFATQLKLCTQRQMAITVRNKEVFYGGFARSVFVGLILGTTFFDLPEDAEGFRNRIGLLFFLLTFNAMNPTQLIPIFVSERTVYYSQRASSFFHPFAYFLSFLLVSIPIVLLEVFLFETVVYPLVDLKGGVFSSEYWYMFLVLTIMNLTARMYTLLLTNLSPNALVAQAVVPVTMVMFMIFCGFLVPRESLPAGWRWFHYISMLTYPLRGMAYNEYHGLTADCASGGLSASCPYLDGDSFLATYDLESSSDPRFENLGIQFLFLFLFTIFASLAITFVSFLNDVADEPVTVGSNEGEEWTQTMTKKPKDATGAVVEFHDLEYTVDVKDKDGNPGKRKLLNKVFGYGIPGKLIALMGASGAGKSTLLDVLAGKKSDGEINGTMHFNGKPKDAFFNRWSGYVEQFDSHEPTATVREAIEFSARLRLPPNTSDYEIDQKVNQVMRILELEHVADEKIGNVETGGVSPEVRKKVTIGVELVMDPACMFLDEPTTGLNSSAALDIVAACSRLSEKSTVICTIHQPSKEIVDQFDMVLLLQKGGTVVYFGNIADIPAYFSKHGFGEYTPGTNIMDFALEVVGNMVGEREKNPDAEDASDVFLASDEGKQVIADLAKGVSPPSLTPPIFHEEYARSSFDQFRTLVGRFHRRNLRDIDSLMARIMPALIMGFVVGTMYFQIAKTQTGAQNRVTIMFLTLMYSFFPSQGIMPVVVTAREIFFRETTNKMYSPGPYYFARMVTDFPVILVQNFLFSTLVYWLAGLNDADDGMHYFKFFSILLICVLNSYAYAELCATIAPDAELATVIFTVPLTIMMLFSGFLINKDAIPDAWSFLFYVNLLRYPLFYLISNELEGLEGFTCTSSEQLPDGSCIYESGNDLLTQFNINADDMSQFFWVTVGIFFVLRTLGFFAIKYVNHVKR